jgi:protoheme ferro-lyase
MRWQPLHCKSPSIAGLYRTQAGQETLEKLGEDVNQLTIHFYYPSSSKIAKTGNVREICSRLQPSRSAINILIINSFVDFQVFGRMQVDSYTENLTS